MGVLPRHANLLLQGAHKPSRAEPAPKQPKSTGAPAPKPTRSPLVFLWRGLFCFLVATGLQLGPRWAKIMGMTMIFTSNIMAIAWSTFLCQEPICRLLR